MAQLLAERFGLQVVHLDAEIERKAGKRIPEIVEAVGWPGFRDLEEEVVCTLASQDGLVIDCGGGVIERDANFEMLRNAGPVVWLQASPATIVARIGGDDQRPSLTGTKTFTDEVVEVLQRRTPLYQRPEVPRAVVEVLQKCGVEVFYPEQKCCGMPSLLEGDRKTTLNFVRFNLQNLASAVADGYDIVCSCPTCGFMLRDILKEGAYFSAEYQHSVGGHSNHMRVPISPKHKNNPGDHQFKVVHPGVYKGLF